LEDVRQMVRCRFRSDDSRNKTRTACSLVLKISPRKFILSTRNCTQLVQSASGPAFSVVFDSVRRFSTRFSTELLKTFTNHSSFASFCRGVWLTNCYREKTPFARVRSCSKISWRYLRGIIFSPRRSPTRK
jgi:hypothetical protein